MGDFFKELANHEEVLFPIIAIGIIFLILLVIYVYSIIFCSEKKQSSYIGTDKKQGRTSGYAYDNPYKDQQQPGRKRSPINQVDSSEKESNQTNQLNDGGWGQYVEDQKSKGIYRKEPNNADGTNYNNINNESQLDSLEEPASVSITPKYDYLEAANGGQFRKLLPSDEKSFFRTWIEDGVRKFEFHGNVDKALANFNAIFDDVCEIEGKQNGATQVENLEPGTLTSQLKVDKPAKIKLK